MNRGTEISLRTRHHPAIDHGDVECLEVGGNAFTQSLFSRRQGMRGKASDQCPAAGTRFLILSVADMADARSEIGIAEEIVEEDVGPKAIKPGDRQSQTRQRKGGQLDQMATFHILPLIRAANNQPALRGVTHSFDAHNRQSDGDRHDMVLKFKPFNWMLTEAWQSRGDHESQSLRMAPMAKIVVIEDEADLREILVEELEDMGHDIEIAVNGEEGLGVILAQTPDLILADINMPKLNGRELRERLVSDHPDHATIPFCFMSAFADKQDIEDGMGVGATHYFTKPLDYGELEDWITNRLPT